MTDPRTLRRKVFARGQGRCHLCGIDTEELRRAYETAVTAARARHEAYSSFARLNAQNPAHAEYSINLSAHRLFGELQAIR